MQALLKTYSKDLFEIIIVADANHTEAELIAERYKSEIEAKLVRIYSNNGFGPASSRNAGIHLAKGDVILSRLRHDMSS